MPDPESSIWDINYADAKARIMARRDRISGRLEAAKRLTTMIKVGQMFGEGFMKTPSGSLDDTGERNLVAVQCFDSRKAITEVLEHGNDLVSNVKLAADHLQKEHLLDVESRTATLKRLLTLEEKESSKAFKEIEKKWPKADSKNQAPTELFAEILKQKEACNELLEKKNELIAIIEDEIKGSDHQYKVLIDDFHENILVLAGRMEIQVQALEELIVKERGKIVTEFEKQRDESMNQQKALWQGKLDELGKESEAKMETRIQMLAENEQELDRIIVEDGEAFVDMKHEMEDNISKLYDQIHFLSSIHQLNEERLDYEIHVLRKHEEEIVLVKAEQKRKITSLQDSINRLRNKVSDSHKAMAKEESSLNASIADVMKQLQKLQDLKKSHSRVAGLKKAQIIEMVRDEVMGKLDEILATDTFIRKNFIGNKSTREIVLFLEPLFAFGTTVSKRRLSEPGGGMKRKSITYRKEEPKFHRKRSSAQLLQHQTMKDVLAILVQKANFLVEENLRHLVTSDELEEKERQLFMLDSILTAIGVEAEEEIFLTLSRHKDDPAKAKDDILKIIRHHVEKSRPSSSSGDSDAKTAKSVRTLRRTSAVAKFSDQDSTSDITSILVDEDDWSRMVESFNQLLEPDLMQTFECLKKLNKVLNSITSLEAENEKLRRQLAEVKDAATKIGAI